MNIFTLPDVISEIKDDKTRESLQVLPYEIQYREPTDVDLKFVVNFAKRTGDYSQLSVTDLRLLALAVRLEIEINKGVNLKDAPSEIQICPTKSSNSAKSSIVKDLEFFGYDVKNRINVVDDVEYDSDVDKSLNDEQETNEIEDKLNVDTKPTEIDVKNDGEDEIENEPIIEHVIIDEDEGWITKDNCQEIRQKLMGIKFNDEDEETKLTVGCITGDYAMQNVLLQMGLNVISPKDGLHIKQTRQFVLRCYACFRINPPTAKQFCKHCGSMKTLKRVSVTINQDGTMEMHINFKKPINLRGTKHSLPTPRGGKHSNDPIICEDQHLPQQRKSKMAVTEKKNLTIESILNDPDYLVRSNPFSINDVYSRASRATNKITTVRNPNETRKSTGNKKKKKNRYV